MDWITGMQRALAFIEEHLTDELDYGEIAARAFSSSYHFQRSFCILCGYTVGEYIRCRRLSQAGAELMAGDIKVIDLALKYGYDSPDGFVRAFARFHGVTPSLARKRGTALKSFSRLSIKLSLEGGNVMDYKIEKRAALDLIGFKRRFSGGLEQRFEQERDFWESTRERQEALAKIRDTPENIWYDVDCGFDGDGYDHYICVAGIGAAGTGFEAVRIPKRLCVAVKTEREKCPTRQLAELRRKIVGEWLPSSGYVLAEGHEVSVLHWYPAGTDEKYIEVSMPIEKAR